VRVLIVHNRYRHAGGEDGVVHDEAALLRRYGVTVEHYERSNSEIDANSRWQTVADTLWSRRTARDVESLIRRMRADIVHVHNTFPLVSPSVYPAARRGGAAVVQTLHNFRLFCVQAMLLRNQAVCEDCLGKSPWRGVLHACYRDSRAGSAIAAGMLTLHRALGTYRRQVSRYIALNDFCRQKFIQAGLPAERIVIKPNFVDICAPEPDRPRQGGLFVGRLSVEKGIEVLARAMESNAQFALDVIGTGPAQALLQDVPGVRLSGWQEAGTIHERMRAAAWIVMPSIWYENFPRVLLEAYACGLPVIASRLGALAELVRDGETGLLFEPGNATDLSEKMKWAAQHPSVMRRIGHAARLEYERRYTPDSNVQQLLEIYRQAVATGP